MNRRIKKISRSALTQSDSRRVDNAALAGDDDEQQQKRFCYDTDLVHRRLRPGTTMSTKRHMAIAVSYTTEYSDCFFV